MLRSIAVLLVAGAVCGSLRSKAMDRALSHDVYEDLYYLPSPATLELVALGHQEALSEVLWMRALVYIGDEFAHRGDVEHIYRYADAILHLDPDFRRVYPWATTMGLYRPIPPSLAEAEHAVSYLERGVARYPDDGAMAWDLAAAYLYELPSLTSDSHEKERFRAIGSELSVTAARLGAGPRWLALTNASHLRTLGRLDQAIRHLEEMYALVRDDETREEIALRLEELHAGARAEAVRAAERQLQDDLRRDYPWIPADFYVVVGPRLRH